MSIPSDSSFVRLDFDRESGGYHIGSWLGASFQDTVEVQKSDLPNLLKTWVALGERLALSVGIMPARGSFFLVDQERLPFFACFVALPCAETFCVYRHMFLVDPAEIVRIEQNDSISDVISRSNGEKATTETLGDVMKSKIDAYRSFCSFLVFVSQVEALAKRDGDHAIGTRVLRFLAGSQFLKQ